MINQNVKGSESSEQAMKIAGLDFEVMKQRLSYTVPDCVDKTLYPATTHEVDRWAVVRKDNGKKVGDAVGKQYEPLQNAKAFEFFDPFVKSGEASYESASSLYGGSKILIQAKLNRNPLVIVGDDTVDKFLTLAHSHNGSIAITVLLTPIRFRCTNQMAMVKKNEATKFLRLKHTKGGIKALGDVQDIVNCMDAEFEATGEQLRLLARKDINQRDLVKYVKTVFDIPENADEMSKQSEKLLLDIIGRYDRNCSVVKDLIEANDRNIEIQTKQNQNVLESILENFETGRGIKEIAVKNSYYSALNAVTDFTTHSYGRNQENRLNSVLFGHTSEVNRNAFELALRA